MHSDKEQQTPDVTAYSPADGAAYWLATLSDENCSEAERQQFSEWLRASTRNIEEFLKLSMLARTANRRADVWPDRSVASLIAEAKANANLAVLRPGAATDDASPRRRAAPWLIAASVAIFAVGAVYLGGAPWTPWPSSTFQTAIGEQRSITLEDGSIIELNSRSHLQTQFTRKLRAVELLEGEAIFRVARDASRPFRVRTGATDIVVVGTAFNVNADSSRTVVTVLEGRVRVDRHAANARAPAESRSRADGIELEVGEQLIVERGRPAIRSALADTDKVTSWTQRRLIFEDTPIAAAAAEFARYNVRQIRIEDAAIGARTITGVFDATDPSALVVFLRADESVSVVAKPDGWVVRASGAGEASVQR